jgi:polygalacturonase
MTDITLQNSPFWTFHPTFCSNVRLERAVVKGRGGNVDGIDPDSCVGVVVRNVSVDVGDDCIALNSGKYGGGVAIGMPTANVLIQNLTCRTPMSIGSGISGGIENVTIKGVRSILGRGCGEHGGMCPAWKNIAVKIKSSRGRGGYVRNITFEDIVVSGGDLVLQINLFMGCQNFSAAAWANCTAKQHPTTPALTPNVHGVTFRSITSTLTAPPARAGWFACLPDSPCTGIAIDGVNLAAASDGWACEHVSGVTHNTTPDPASCFEALSSLPSGRV